MRLRDDDEVTQLSTRPGSPDGSPRERSAADTAREAGDKAKAAVSERLRPLVAWRDRVRARPGGTLAWRIGVTVVGVAIIGGGIVLLPLPGPGWLIIFAGLGVLATEYDWAKRLLRFARAQVGRWTDWIKEQPRWLQGLVGLGGLVFLAAVFYVVYLVLYA